VAQQRDQAGPIALHELRLGLGAAGSQPLGEGARLGARGLEREGVGRHPPISTKPAQW
jgi:hypothetical protein